MDDVFAAMAAKWPSAIVTRPQVEAFSGGLIRGSYLAHLDAEGVGPPRIRIGSRWAYPVDDLAAWLRSRAEKTEEKQNEKPNDE